jgi:hypothetical protein
VFFQGWSRFGLTGRTGNHQRLFSERLEKITNCFLQTLHGRTVSADGKRNVRQTKGPAILVLMDDAGQLNYRQWTPRTTFNRFAVFLSHHDKQCVILVKKQDFFIEFTIKELSAFFISCVHFYEAVPR